MGAADIKLTRIRFSGVGCGTPIGKLKVIADADAGAVMVFCGLEINFFVRGVSLLNASMILIYKRARITQKINKNLE